MTAAFDMILLPGMGADARMFAPQQRAFPGLRVPAWLPPRPRESLAHFARRMVETVEFRRPLVLGGVSLGGMIAWEMAQHLRPEALLLISSCSTRGGLRGVFRAGRPLAPCIPMGLIKLAKLMAPLYCGRIGQSGAQHRGLVVTMFRDADAWFLKWALAAVLDWQPCAMEGTPVYRIHGAHDLVIPARRVAADVLLPGGHLINLSHAGEVNRFIAQVVAETAAERPEHGEPQHSDGQKSDRS
jgi:pimeloyl-ACP methyl ester carboxylesterase